MGKIYSEGARALSEEIIKNIPVCDSTAGVSCCYSARSRLARCAAAVPVQVQPYTSFSESWRGSCKKGNWDEAGSSELALLGSAWGKLPNRQKRCRRKFNIYLNKMVFDKFSGSDSAVLISFDFSPAVYFEALCTPYL